MILPKIITDIDSIPSLMKQIDNWVNWRYAEVGGRLTKIPYIPSSFGTGNLKGAKANDPSTWDSFENACKNLDSRTGIGFEIGNTSLVCCDLDHVKNTNGTISDTAGEIVELFSETYKEDSPSGTGIHIWMIAELPSDHPKKKNGVELYSSGRFITMTGKSFGEVCPIKQQHEEALSLLCGYMDYKQTPTLDSAPLTPISDTAPKAETASPTLTSPQSEIELQKEDEEVICRILDSKDGQTFATLYFRFHMPKAVNTLLTSELCRNEQEAIKARENILQCYDNDDSKMDYALIKIIDKWNEGHREQSDRIFRCSDLYRDKWDEKRENSTYGIITTNKAIEQNRKEGYPTSLSSVVEAQEPQGEEIETLPPVSSYSVVSMRDEYEENLSENNTRVSTGFPYLNMLLDGGFYPSLIVLGAQPGEGKTALGLQIMNNIAKNGTDALIVSLEMSRFELIERSISCITHRLFKEEALDIAQIMSSKSKDSKLDDVHRTHLKTATELFFQDYAPNLYIHESMGTMDVDKLQQLLENHIAQTGYVPVVMLDYIQLLQQPKSIRHGMSDKQVMDYNFTRLKQISRDFNTPVLSISSLNRATYSRPISGDEAKVKSNRVGIESFKESGIIEYSADIVLGLNRVGKERKDTLRTVELDILKNRHGKKGTTQCFDYYAGYNRFVDVSRTPTLE